MKFSKIPGKNRRENLLCNDFLFKKIEKKGFTQYYKCIDNNCGSRLSFDLQKNIIINLPSSHNHLPPQDELADRNFREKLKKKLETDPTTNLKNLHQNELQNFFNELLNEDEKENFLPPSYEKVRQVMTRKRLKVLPKSPKFFADINIDPPWFMTLNKKRFLLYQESKILIVATDFGLKFLALSKNCLADGTFKTAPPPFY